MEPGSEISILPPDGSRGGPAHDRRGADIEIAQIAEDLAKSIQFFFQEPGNDFVGAVARRNPGTSVDDHRIDVALFKGVDEQSFNLGRLILNDPISRGLMSFQQPANF